MTKDTLTIRFFRGESEIGEASLVDGQTILEVTEDAGSIFQETVRQEPVELVS